MESSSHTSLRVLEDGGLTTLMGGQHHASAPVEVVRTPEVLAAVMDVLKLAIPVALLDPVAPASARTPVVLEVLRRVIGEQAEAGRGLLRQIPTDEETLLALFRDTLGWGPAQAYLDDARIQEVKIIGTQIAVQEDGCDFVLVPERFTDSRQVLARAQLLASRLNVALNHSSPQGTLPLAHGTRMHVTVPPCVPEGTALVCIRRGRTYAWTLEDVQRKGAFSPAVGDLLLLFARAKCSFLIAGETGSGKTALLESLVNSWPGQPHIITIEDNTQEINIKHEMWTRELVQTAVEPGAFGRAAREALRQTPSVIAPGETRAEEAGAILTLAVSGHAILTTLHAKSGQAAVMRFADCAAMPGAYVYEGRRNNALEDVCDNIEVVIHIEKLDGTRYIREIGLLNGAVTDAHGTPRPRLVPLVEMVVDDAGSFTWPTRAVAVGDTLRWEGETDETPAILAQKLRLLRAAGRVRSAPTSRAAADRALAVAGQLTVAGQLDQALVTLRRAWADSRDERLIAAAARVLETDSSRMAAATAMSTAQAQAIEALLDRRAWGLARRRMDEVQRDLLRMSTATPAGRWEAILSRIAAGVAVDAEVSTRATRARQALERGTHAQEVLLLLGDDRSDRASPDAALAALTVRRDAVAQLVAAGEVRSEVREAMTAQMQALTAMQEVPDA